MKHPLLSLFNSPELKPLQQALDGRLQELQASQKPGKKTADAVSVTDEREMWNTGVLGTGSPDSIINTLLFLTGKLFALRGGKEQRELNWTYGSTVSFQNRPIGWNTQSKRFKQMCHEAGLKGNYSNHSGRVTAFNVCTTLVLEKRLS